MTYNFIKKMPKRFYFVTLILTISSVSFFSSKLSQAKDVNNTKHLTYPSKAVVKEVCNLVANPEKYRSDFEKIFPLDHGNFFADQSIIDDISQVQGFIDVNNDGEVEMVMNSIDGTAHVKSFNVIDLKKSKKIDLKYNENNLIEMGWGLGYIRWLKYKNYTFLLNGKSAQMPERLSYFGPNNNGRKICEFKLSNKLIDTASASAEAKEAKITWAENLCKDLGENKIKTYLTPLQDKEFMVDHNNKGSGKYFISDIGNNDKKVKIYSVVYSSGGGPGCEKESLILEDDKKNNLLTEENIGGLEKIVDESKISKFSKLFYETQAADVSCKNRVSPKILRYNGFDLLEMDNSDYPERKRQVWLFKDNKSVPLCKFEYKIEAKTSY